MDTMRVSQPEGLAGTAGGPGVGAEWVRNWPVVAASAGGVGLSTVHLYSLGVFMAPLQAQFGWSRALISSGLTIGSVIGVVTFPLTGLLIDRVGPRRVALVGAPVFCALVAMLSLTGPSVWSWLAIWTGLAIAVNGITPTVWTSAVSSLFARGRGLALSVTLCGTGLGSSLTPILANALNTAYGWRGAYLGLAAVWAALVLPMLVFLFTSEKDRRRIRPAATPLATAALLTGLTAREGFRSPRFIKLAIAASAIALVAVSFVVDLVPILASEGIARGRAAEIAGVVGLTSIIGRLSGGYLLDRINGNLVAAVSVLLPILSSALLLSLPGSTGVATAAAAVLGLSLGAELDAVAYLATRHLGLRSFGVLFGTIAGLLSVATGFGPLLVSATFDATRSYNPVLWAYIPVCALAAILFLSLGRYPDHPPGTEALNVGLTEI